MGLFPMNVGGGGTRALAFVNLPTNSTAMGMKANKSLVGSNTFADFGDFTVTLGSSISSITKTGTHKVYAIYANYRGQSTYTPTLIEITGTLNITHEAYLVYSV